MSPLRSTSRTARDGYTLLEVILAMSLSMVLLSALWVALRVNLKLFDSGRAHVEQAQLARALLRQINDDLQNVVIPQSAKTDPTATQFRVGTGVEPNDKQAGSIDTGLFAAARSDFSGHVRRSHLIGDRHSLEIDICRYSASAPPVDQPQGDQPATTATDVVRVRYFLAGLDPLADQYREHSIDEIEGLVREELDWAAVVKDAAEMSSGGRTSAIDRTGNDYRTTNETSVATFDENFSATDADSGNTGQLFVPEAVWLELSYFDGNMWHEEWDSDAEGSWPVAVDVKLTIRPEDVAGDRATHQDERVQAVIPEKLPTYRLVAFIEQAKSGATSADQPIEEGSGGRSATESFNGSLQPGEMP